MLQSRFFLVAATLLALCTSSVAHGASRPNVVVILADDLGYGDVQCYGGKIPTPNIDRLAAAGMRFTDAHTSSSVCSPTRYGLLTGRYNWRSKLKRGVLGGLSPRLIEPGRMTLASLLKAQGYHTGCVGKWHLGMDWAVKPGAEVTELNIEPREQVFNVDYAQPIANGPNSVGFDYYYGIAASLDMVPYTFIENDRVTALPTEDRDFLMMHGREQGGKTRKGPTAAGFDAADVLPTLVSQIVRIYRPLCRRRAGGQAVFPVRAAGVAPHPDSAHPRLAGQKRHQSLCGFRDADRRGRRRDPGDARPTAIDRQHAGDYDQRQRLFPAGQVRGTGRTRTSSQRPLARPQGRYLRGRPSSAVRRPLAGPGRCANGEPAARLPDRPPGYGRGDPRLPAAGRSRGGQHQLPARAAGSRGGARPPGLAFHQRHVRDPPRGVETRARSGFGRLERPAAGQQAVADLPRLQLYNLADDLGEQHNLQDREPERVRELTALLERLVAEGRSTPGKRQPNNGPVDIGTSGSVR